MPLEDFLKQVDQSSGGFKKQKTWLSDGGFITLNSSGTPKSNHISFTSADRKDLTSRQYGNLFSSFNYPITDDQIKKFTGTTFANGGLVDTSFSGIGNQNKVIVIDIPRNQYGELIDGKTLKLTVPSGNTTIDLYGTYYDDPISILDPDSLYSDPQPQSHEFGQPDTDNPSNCAFLFTDSLTGRTSRPNGSTANSWATGYLNKRPFGKGGKFLANFQDDPTSNKKKDMCSGVAYLDKGFCVIHEEDIVRNIEKIYGNDHTKTGSSSSVSTSASCQYKSFSTELINHVVCVSDLSEHNISQNKTYESVYGVGGVNADSNTIVYVSEIGLYNSKNELIAICKPSEPIPKSKNSIIVLDVQIKI